MSTSYVYIARRSGVQVAGWTAYLTIWVWFPANPHHVWTLWWQGDKKRLQTSWCRCWGRLGTLKARRGFAFVTESWVRKFDGQLSVCAQITYDVMEIVGAKEITSFTVESRGCKAQCLGVFFGRVGQSCWPVKYLFSNGKLNILYQRKAD